MTKKSNITTVHFLAAAAFGMTAVMGLAIEPSDNRRDSSPEQVESACKRDYPLEWRECVANQAENIDIGVVKNFALAAGFGGLLALGITVSSPFFRKKTQDNMDRTPFL